VRRVADTEPTGAPTPMAASNVLTSLMTVIAGRKANPPAERSYVASLLEGGVAKIGGKIMEEAAEVVEAAGEPGREHLVKEVADLVFHALVMLAHRDTSWSAVEDELSRRFGVSGVVEKESRGRESGD